MDNINGYATLADFKSYITASGQTMATDTADDAVIEKLLAAASRWIDNDTSRSFYPRIETRYFDVPEPVDDELMLDDDLLAIVSLTNGDGTAISSTDYRLLPANRYPKYSIKLKSSSNLYWEWDSEGNDQAIIAVNACWGYHNEYTAHGWKQLTTLGEDLDINELDWTVASITGFAQGQLCKVGSEIGLVESVSTPLVAISMVQRGAVGSTPATHTTGEAVYVWQTQSDIWQACIEITNNAYHRRYGQNVSGQSTITPGGLVLAPQDITEMAQLTIERYWRR